MRLLVTVKDVAELAGVSTATVSRALNGFPQVSQHTRDRVKRAADQLGYHPSRAARQLRVGTTQILGLLITDIADPFFAAAVRGIEDVAWRRGYSLILADSDEDLAREEECVQTLLAHRVAGAIVVPTHEDLAGPWHLLTDNGIPLVVMDRRLPGQRADTVLVDNAAGTTEALDYLIGLGHRRVAFIGGLSHTTTMRERRAAYEAALSGRGIPLQPDLVRSGDSKLPGGYRLAKELLALDSPPTAIFAANNLMTLGALNAIHERGLHIPEDVSIVGFDDMPWATALNPPLTAVAQPAYELGRTAADLLLSRISEPSRDAVEVRLQPGLIVRASCGISSR